MQPEIEQRLAEVFEARQAALLAEVIASAAGDRVLTDELRALAQSVTALAEAQQRTEQRLEALAEAQQRTEQRLEALAEAQQRTEQRLEALAEAQQRTEQRLEALAEAQQRTEQRLEALAEAQQRTEQRLEALVEAQRDTEQRLGLLTRTVETLTKTMEQIANKLGHLDGRMLELTYRERAGAYFGPLVRRMRVVPPHTLEDGLESRLTPEEFLDVLRLDLLISGRPRRAASPEEVWLAVEVSAVVDQHDVTRARRRASLLRKAGYQAVPVVAGERLTANAEGAARAQAVVVMLDGHVLHWDEAVAAAAAGS